MRKIWEIMSKTSKVTVESLTYNMYKKWRKRRSQKRQEDSHTELPFN